MLRELDDVNARPLLITFEKSWWSGEVPEDWWKANIIPIFKKGKEEGPENYRLVSCFSVRGKVMEQILLEIISKHFKTR